MKIQFPVLPKVMTIHTYISALYLLAVWLSSCLVRVEMADRHESDKNIEIWKIKKLIKALESARGNGTSMISLIMPPRDQISRVTKMLGDEFGTASNIKSRVNRQSVLGAIT